MESLAFALPISFFPNYVRSLRLNIGMPAFGALRANLVQPEVRGRLFGLFRTSFTSGSVIGPTFAIWIYDTYQSTVFNILGVNVPGYGILFFINATLGIFSTTNVMILMEEPKEECEAPQFAVFDVSDS